MSTIFCKIEHANTFSTIQIACTGDTFSYSNGSQAISWNNALDLEFLKKWKSGYFEIKLKTINEKNVEAKLQVLGFAALFRLPLILYEPM